MKAWWRSALNRMCSRQTLIDQKGQTKSTSAAQRNIQRWVGVTAHRMMHPVEHQFAIAPWRTRRDRPGTLPQPCWKMVSKRGTCPEIRRKGFGYSSATGRGSVGDNCRAKNGHGHCDGLANGL
jgi:hypothetical protein